METYQLELSTPGIMSPIDSSLIQTSKLKENKHIPKTLKISQLFNILLIKLSKLIITLKNSQRVLSECTQCGTYSYVLPMPKFLQSRHNPQNPQKVTFEFNWIFLEQKRKRKCKPDDSNLERLSSVSTVILGEMFNLTVGFPERRALTFA